MTGIITGIFISTCLFFLVHFAKKKQLSLKWWQWFLSVSQICFMGFIIQMIFSFLIEGTPKAALVMGSLFGFIASISGVLLLRFVFSAKNLRVENE